MFFFSAEDNTADENVNAPMIPECAVGKTKVFRYSAVGIALIAALFRSLSLVFSFDSDPGYFVSGAFLPTVANILTLIGVCWCAMPLFLIPRDVLPKKADFSTGGVYFTSVYTGFIMIADAGYRLYNILQPKAREEIRMYFAHPEMRTQRIVAIVSIACIVISALGGISFYFKAPGKNGKKGSAILGLFPVIRSVCGIALCYFDMTVPLNSPLKTGTEFALMAMMLFLTYEVRFDLYEEKVMPRAYFASGLAVLVICGVNGFSGIVAYFGGYCVNGELSIEAFIISTLFFYALARLKAYCENRGVPLTADGDENETEDITVTDCARDDDNGNSGGDIK